MRKDCEGCAYLRGFGYCIYNGECTDLDSWTDIVDVTKMVDIDDCKKLPKEMLKADRIKHQEFVDELQRTVETSGGIRNDADKPDWSLLPLKTIEGLVKVLTYGAKKYSRDNWKKVSNERNFAALMRHLSKWQDGEEFDPESGLHHLDHALCDLMFIRHNIVPHKNDGEGDKKCIS